MVVEISKTPIRDPEEKGYYFLVANGDKMKATMMAEVTIITNKNEIGYIGCFQDGKICGLLVKKATGGRMVGRGLYDAKHAYKSGGWKTPQVSINDNSAISFVNEIIRKYN